MSYVPSPYEFVLLALASYRLTRLLGWDSFPLAAKLRGWAIGEDWVAGEEISFPGKTPDTDLVDVRPAYRRPALAHLVHCPFCLGFWVSLAFYLAWLALPTATLAVAAVGALSAIVGLIAKALDP